VTEGKDGLATEALRHGAEREKDNAEALRDAEVCGEDFHHRGLEHKEKNETNAIRHFFRG
jgi:hypothetical protein